MLLLFEMFALAVSVNEFEAPIATSAAVPLTVPRVCALNDSVPAVAVTVPLSATVALEVELSDSGNSRLLTATSLTASAASVMLPLVATRLPRTWIDAALAANWVASVTCVASSALAVKAMLPVPVVTVKPALSVIDSAPTLRPPLKVKSSPRVTESVPAPPRMESSTALRLEASSKKNASSALPRSTLIVPVESANPSVVNPPTSSHWYSSWPEPFTRRCSVSAPELPVKVSVLPTEETDPPNKAS